MISGLRKDNDCVDIEPLVGMTLMLTGGPLRQDKEDIFHKR